MSKIFFHPHIKAIDAARIAREQGGRLVWRDARPCITKAQILADAADSAVMRGHYEAALQNTHSARQQIAKVLPCAS